MVKLYQSGMTEKNDKYMILVTNGLGSKSHTEQGRVKYDANDIEFLSDRLRAYNIRVIPVAITRKCSQAEMGDLTMVCPEWDLLQKWSYPNDAFRTLLPFSMANPQAHRDISSFIAEELVAQGSSCQDPMPQQAAPKKLFKSDITILIDGSDSIKRHEWSDTKNAVSEWMSGYWGASPDSQISVRQFSDVSSQEFGPGDKYSDPNWEAKIQNMKQRASATMMHDALQEVVSDDYTMLRNYNDEQYNVLLLVTDGWPTDETFNNIRSGGRRFNEVFDIVIAIGVGNEVDSDRISELVQQLGVDLRQSDIRTVPDYRSLMDQFPAIRSKVSKIMNNMIFSRVRRAWPIIKAETEVLTRSRRQLDNRGPRPNPDMDECECTVTIPEVQGDQGRSGEPGRQGPEGPRGDVGRDGADGNSGNPGRDGARGPVGPKGDEGSPGRDGSEGRDGSAGRPGRPGPVGEVGDQGPPGDVTNSASRGELGPSGSRGDDGREGSPGPYGPPGQPGRDGERGPRGESGDQGDEGPMGPRGEEGPTGVSSPGQPGTCGDSGNPGQDGMDGIDGRDGTDGADGEDGVDGSIGEPGNKGNQGPKGPAGVEGEEGECGHHGQNGQQGLQGPTGPKGVSGMDGRPGLSGVKGAKGTPGRDGIDGPMGNQGPSGAAGNAGSPGIPGLSGSNGDAGPDGPDGDDGIDGVPGAPGPKGDSGKRGPPGFKGPNGEVDLSALYVQIKEWLRPMVKCPHCDTPVVPTQPPPQMEPVPISAVFLVDGSDSIRGAQGNGVGANEWQLSSLAVQEITRQLINIHELTVVQFSDGDPIDHIILADVNDDNRDERIEEIADTLGNSQIERGTYTYHALDYISDLISENNESHLTALFVITDGEPRDDDNSQFVERVLDRVEDIFDYVFPIAIGRDFETDSQYGQQARQNMREIQGRVTSDPIFLQDYRSVAAKVVQEFRRVDENNEMKRMKRQYISEHNTARGDRQAAVDRQSRPSNRTNARTYHRRKKTHPLKKWSDLE